MEKGSIIIGNSLIVSYELKHDLALLSLPRVKMFYENLHLNIHSNCSLWFPKQERIQMSGNGGMDGCNKNY